MDNKISRPAICIPLADDESAIGYFKRLADINVVDPNDLVLPIRCNSLFAKNLQPVLEENKWIEFSAARHNMLVEMSKLNFKHLSKQLKYCPLCLQEGEAWQNGWHFLCSAACIKHAVWLLDTCRYCGKTLSLAHTSFHHCRSCGFDMRRATSQTQKCPEEVIALQCFLEGKPLPSTSMPLLWTDFSELTLEERSELLQLFVRFQPQPDGSMRQVYKYLSNKDSAKVCLYEVAHSLFGGYVGLWNYLCALKIFDEGAVSSRFTKFYRTFYNLCTHACFEPYKEVIEQFINNHWHKALSKRNNLFASKTIQTHPWVPLQQACRMYGLSKRTLRRAVADGMLTGKVEKKACNTSILIYKPDIERKVIRLKDVLNAAEAATLLGVTKAQFKQLRDAGTFKQFSSPESDYCSTWQFSKMEIESYMEKVLRHTAVVQSDYLCIPDIMRAYGHKCENLLSRLLEAVEANELIAKQFSAKPSVRSLAIKKSDLLHWLDTTLPTDHYYSVPRVAKLLGVNQQFTYELVHYGLLHSDETDHGYDITDEHLMAFHIEYVLLSKLSKSTGVNSRNLIKHLMDYEIYSVDKDWPVKLRQKVYRREEVEAVEWLNELTQI